MFEIVIICLMELTSLKEMPSFTSEIITKGFRLKKIQNAKQILELLQSLLGNRKLFLLI